MSNATPAQQALELARELLDDLELSRVNLESLIYKASRLARLVEDDTIAEWLSMERSSLPNSEVGRYYMGLTGRWIEEVESKGWWSGATALEAQRDAWQAQLSQTNIPNLSGEYLNVPIGNIQRSQTALTKGIATMGAILGRVRGLVHDFAATRYYELVFSGQQVEMFETARRDVDQLLAPLSGGVLNKIESIYRRLGEGDPEATSQALLTCRRLIDSVADAMFPPVEGSAMLGGTEVAIGPQHHKNRLNALVAASTDSSGRRDRLKRTLGDLYSRVSSGVHAEVSAEEARFLFLSTYMYLGEVLALAAESQGTKA